MTKESGGMNVLEEVRSQLIDLVFEAGLQWKKRAERAEALIAELLDNFDPYITAWEAKDPHSSDGEELARRMREVIGRKDEA